MLTSADLTSDKNENLSFVTSSKGQRLLAMNEQVYKCHRRRFVRNTRFVLLVDA